MILFYNCTAECFNMINKFAISLNLDPRILFWPGNWWCFDQRTDNVLTRNLTMFRLENWYFNQGTDSVLIRELLTNWFNRYIWLSFDLITSHVWMVVGMTLQVFSTFCLLSNTKKHVFYIFISVHKSSVNSNYANSCYGLSMTTTLQVGDLVNKSVVTVARQRAMSRVWVTVETTVLMMGWMMMMLMVIGRTPTLHFTSGSSARGVEQSVFQQGYTVVTVSMI